MIGISKSQTLSTPINFWRNLEKRENKTEYLHNYANPGKKISAFEISIIDLSV